MENRYSHQDRIALTMDGLDSTLRNTVGVHYTFASVALLVLTLAVLYFLYKTYKSEGASPFDSIRDDFDPSLGRASSMFASNTQDSTLISAKYRADLSDAQAVKDQNDKIMRDLSCDSNVSADISNGGWDYLIDQAKKDVHYNTEVVEGATAMSPEDIVHLQAMVGK